MRTDSMKYSPVFLKEISSYIQKHYTDNKYLGNLSTIENNDSSNPHEAIRITDINTYGSVNYSNIRLNNIYRIIWENTVESCMSDYEYISYLITITAPEHYLYKHTIETPKFLGWKIISKSIKNTTNSLVFYLQTLEKTQNFTYNYINSFISIISKERYYTEAALIKDLEERGVGRPSTFAMIVDTIQERGYVKKMDIEGKTYKITEYNLRKGESIKVEEREKIFGNEKNKLVIQNTGTIVCEFLVEYFSNLFSYDYTKKLELELDEIAIQVREPWYNTCKTCLLEIESLISSLKIHKKEYTIDKYHTLFFSKYGPVIRNTKNNEEDTTIQKPKFYSVRKDITIDIDRLKDGKYILEELLEIREKSLGQITIEDNNTEVILKSGKYGYYIEWKKNKEVQNHSVENIIKTKKISAENLSINDILEIVDYLRSV
jgi:DNA topoisomerase-1